MIIWSSLKLELMFVSIISDCIIICLYIHDGEIPELRPLDQLSSFPAYSLDIPDSVIPKICSILTIMYGSFPPEECSGIH